MVEKGHVAHPGFLARANLEDLEVLECCGGFERIERTIWGKSAVFPRAGKSVPKNCGFMDGAKIVNLPL